MATNIKKKVVRVTVLPTITAGLYASGQALGARMEFANAFISNTVSGTGLGLASGTIIGLQVVDLAKQNANIDIVLFDRSFTTGVDNTAFDAADAELPNAVGAARLLSGNYNQFVDNSVGTMGEDELRIPVISQSSSLWAQAVIRGSTPTYASTGDIRFTFTIEQDEN